MPYSWVAQNIGTYLYANFQFSNFFALSESEENL